MTATHQANPGGWSGEELDVAMESLVERGAVEVPPYPAVAMAIERLVAGGDFGLDALARLVSSDQALAADVLRCANTAAFSRGAPAASVPQAVARIGAAELSRIALASALGGRALARGALAPLRRRAWHDALAAGVLARELARPRQVAADEAFTCGLLHDFGRVLAIECLERIGRGTRSPPRMPARFWTAVVEQHHLRLGAILAERWGLPEVIVESMTLHHADEPERARFPRMLEVVVICDRMVRLLDEQASVRTEDVETIRALSEQDTEALVRGVEVVPGLVAAFERETPPGEETYLEPPPPPQASPARGGLRLRVGRASYAVTGFAPHQLVLSGEQPLTEGTLLEVALDEPGAAPFHARVTLCWQEAGRHGIMLMPFGLGGQALLRWQGLTGGARS